MSDFTKLAVGSPLPFNAPGEICFTMSGGNPTLIIQLPNLTAEEIQSVKSGEAQFKVIGLDGVIFWLVKLGTMEWMDVPYSPHLDKGITIPEIPDGTGLAIQIILVEATTRIVKVLRLITVPTNTSRSFLKKVQYELQQPFNFNEYGLKVQKIYASYSTAALVKMTSTN
ncbi:hypothetical protein [Megasphaera elsdenii]|uniref:hypothetical protein n=1 Tax=Megasphaera elsdenii TaxID=907 RepID=UPI0035227AE3